MTTPSLLMGIVTGAAIYGAAALQLGLADELGPQFLLMIAAWWLRISPPARGVVGAACLGLLIDMLSHHRLGLHLATCGILAAIAGECLSERQRRHAWSLPLLTGWLVMGDAVVSRTVLAIQRGEIVTFPDLWKTGVPSAWWSMVLVAGCLVGGDLVRRYVEPWRTSYGPQLTNTWTGLTEGD